MWRHAALGLVGRQSAVCAPALDGCGLHHQPRAATNVRCASRPLDPRVGRAGPAISQAIVHWLCRQVPLLRHAAVRTDSSIAAPVVRPLRWYRQAQPSGTVLPARGFRRRPERARVVSEKWPARARLTATSVTIVAHGLANHGRANGVAEAYGEPILV